MKTRNANTAEQQVRLPTVLTSEGRQARMEGNVELDGCGIDDMVNVQMQVDGCTLPTPFSRETVLPTTSKVV